MKITSNLRDDVDLSNNAIFNQSLSRQLLVVWNNMAPCFRHMNWGTKNRSWIVWITVYRNKIVYGEHSVAKLGKGELQFPCVWLCAWPVIVGILSKTVYGLLIILGLEAHG
jgi:hypothetical protein